jgi:hypothetical protein
MRTTAAITLTLLLLGPSLSRAQSPTASPAPTTSSAEAAAVTRAAQEAAEDVVLTRVLAGLQLTPSQLTELLPFLEDAQRRLQALESESADAIARHKPALEEARNQFLAGKTPSTRAEIQYAETVQLGQTKRVKLRADLVASLKRILAKQLGPAQEARLVQTARSVAFQERTAGWRVDAMTGNRGGGPITFMGRMMDRIRELSPEDWAQQQQRLGAAGAGGGRGGPEMAQMMAQVRAMPADSYQQQKNDLALRVFDSRFSSTAQDPQAEVDRFLDRYFLSPRLPPVMRQQLGARSGR